MFSDPVSFNGGTRVEVITVLANCGVDTDRARRALVTWIRHKQDKGRSTEHILVKLRDIESKFIKDTTLHSAFRDARAETFLPRAPDLPLPSHLRRKSTEHTHTPGSLSSVIIPTSIGLSSSVMDLPADLRQRTGPPISLRLSRGSSQTSEILLGKSIANQRISLPQGVSRASQFRSPRIQIPHDRSLPGPSSPITSSPEESEIPYRYRHLSHPVGPSSSQSNGLVTPVSASPPELPFSPISSRNLVRTRPSHDFVPPPPSARISIPRSRSQRSAPLSPPTSSDESDFYRRRYRPLSQPAGTVSPGNRRVTPARTSPPDVPLPPIPSDDQGTDSDSDMFEHSLRTDPPPTPVRSVTLYQFTPTRPLPIQPIPSPVPASDESEHIDMMDDENSLRQNWREPNGDLPLDFVDRQDSPVYVLHDDHATPTGIGPPPPYIDQLDTYFPTDMPTIRDSLDRAMNEYGGSPEVRRVVTRCIEFQSGYEPPYWQTRLLACGLDVDAVGHLVAEMCKQVDWTSSFRR